ncbi:MAG: oligosaccharide flippase family protein [Bacteroidetes bacterium]|nr:oligosaccharide flippase family protein [Bacteroidota bacterium]
MYNSLNTMPTFVLKTTSLDFQSYKEKLQHALQDKNFGFVLKGSLSTAITLFFVQGLRFISGVLIGRFYGAEASGQLTLIVTVMGLFSIFINFGVKEALQKLIPELREKYNLKTAYSVFLKGNQLILLLSLLAGVVLYTIAPYLTTYWEEPNMLWLFRASGIFLPFFVLGDLNYFSLRAALKVHTANMSLMIPTIIRLLVLLIITFYFYNSYNPIYLHWSTLCVLPWLFSLYPIYKYFHQPAAKEDKITTTEHKEIMLLALPMLMTYLAFAVNNSADVFILKDNDIGTDLVGIYKTCTNISMLAATLLVALNTTVQPKMTQLYAQNNMSEVQRISVKSSKLIFLLSIPVFIILLFFSKQVMWLYGEEFMKGAICLSILTIGQVVNTICGPVAQLLNGTGYHKQFRNISFLGMAINIIANLILIPFYGIMGAAIANSISMMVWNIVGTFYIKQKFGFYIVYIPFVNLNKKNL